MRTRGRRMADVECGLHRGIDSVISNKDGLADGVANQVVARGEYSHASDQSLTEARKLTDADMVQGRSETAISLYLKASLAKALITAATNFRVAIIAVDCDSEAMADDVVPRAVACAVKSDAKLHIQREGFSERKDAHCIPVLAQRGPYRRCGVKLQFVLQFFYQPSKILLAKVPVSESTAFATKSFCGGKSFAPRSHFPTLLPILVTDLLWLLLPSASFFFTSFSTSALDASSSFILSSGDHLGGGLMPQLDASAPEEGSGESWELESDPRNIAVLMKGWLGGGKLQEWAEEEEQDFGSSGLALKGTTKEGPCSAIVYNDFPSALPFVVTSIRYYVHLGLPVAK
ncbi:hypothetical protein BDK51DRAFT_43284 [Blyttiomyces helicus]|uniref:Uncharacterized protein n=1 Tax=Blyttiomyces helicus TaxID=388810 RepID=A0A4P9WBC1_9FUNG|nr:hypothetical protein BDK51DRAFT_43284 [Blyttiomyces helicus]|eukprot:RKO88843.1 hypothetical protein BDK51DRAFT_43284 [Blyttiomyces helicus]